MSVAYRLVNLSSGMQYKASSRNATCQRWRGGLPISCSTQPLVRFLVSTHQQPRLHQQHVCQTATQSGLIKHRLNISAACLSGGLSRSTSHCSYSSRPGPGPVCCNSTAGPQPPGPLNHPIPWLCEVQAWPAPGGTVSRELTASDHQHGNGNGNSVISGNGSSGTTLPCSAAEGQIVDIDAGSLDDLQFDAIMVLAGGLTADGGLPEWVHRRLDVARGLHLAQHRKPPVVCLGGGTPHKPAILGPSGHVIHESTSCAKYLMDTGVHAADIYKEVSSYDTVGNAYFSLTIHALPSGWRRLAVVTSHFHMPRSRALFADLYQLAGSSLFNDPHWYSLTFLSATDEGVFDDYVYNARLGKEAGSLQHWRSVASGLTRLSDFHAWLHADHLCYAVPRQHEFGNRQIKDPKLLESY